MRKPYTLDVHIESEDGNVDTERVSATVRQALKLRGRIHVEPAGSLPNDGKIIDDQRHYDGA